MEAKPWTDAEIEWVIAGGFNAVLEMRRNATLRELLALRAEVERLRAEGESVMRAMIETD